MVLPCAESMLVTFAIVSPSSGGLFSGVSSSDSFSSTQHVLFLVARPKYYSTISYCSFMIFVVKCISLVIF